MSYINVEQIISSMLNKRCNAYTIPTITNSWLLCGLDIQTPLKTFLWEQMATFKLGASVHKSVPSKWQFFKLYHTKRELYLEKNLDLFL